MAEFSLLKKFSLPHFSFNFLAKKPASVVGVDIGTYSVKVVQLRHERERAVLETYGELLTAGYLKESIGKGEGFMRYLEDEIVALLKNAFRESNVTSKEVIFSVPAPLGFITTISFPQVPVKEIEAAIPFEARKYVPIPIADVILDWELLGSDGEDETMYVLLVAVPKEVVEKFKRITELLGVKLRALELESFSIVRSLGMQGALPTAFINFGHQSTTIAIADKEKLRVAHSISRGAHEFTKALERGLGISEERAEGLKRETGLSERIEEQEISSILAPLLEGLLGEIERFFSLYNRRAPRTIQRIIITGGGSRLKGLIEYTASKFGIEVIRGNPFSRISAPPFMQPIFRELGPNLSVAIGLALHEMRGR